MNEAGGGGFEPIGLSVPLVTGGSVHIGFASLMRQARDGETLSVESAVIAAVADYEKRCANRNFALDMLESQSYVFNEQRALTEALVRAAGLRAVPQLLPTYEVLEVEKMDKAELVSSPESNWSVLWRSIPDALLRHRDSGELYTLSVKTTGEFDPRRDQEMRNDMQNLSEPWAVEQRLRQWALEPAQRPDWFRELTTGNNIGPSIRGVQMLYLIKGQRRKMGKEAMAAEGLSAEQIAAGGAMYKQASPLIYGYRKDTSGGLAPPELAFNTEWQCSAPHPMRRSKWYPTGECPGDGRNHRRDDEWKSFPVWDSPDGVAGWIGKLAAGEITPEAGDPLNQSWAMPIPHYRDAGMIESWRRQTAAAERRRVEALMIISAVAGDSFRLNEWLDEFFPQTTAFCGDWYGRRCPCYDLCHGPEHIRRDPVGSGLYRVKTQYEPAEVDG